MEGKSVGFNGLCNLGLRLVIEFYLSGINTFIYVTDDNEKENVKDKNVAWLTSSAEIAKKCRYRCYLFTQASVSSLCG